MQKYFKTTTHLARYDEIEAEEMREKYTQGWEAQLHRESSSMKKHVSWNSITDEVDITSEFLEPKDDFNTQISSHLLLQRLFLLFGLYFSSSMESIWAMALSYETGCWLSISNLYDGRTAKSSSTTRTCCLHALSRPCPHLVYGSRYASCCFSFNRCHRHRQT